MRNRLALFFCIHCALAVLGAVALWAQDNNVAPPTNVKPGIFAQLAARPALPEPHRMAVARTPSPLTSSGAVKFTFGTLDFPKSANSSAGAINDKGQVAGAFGRDYQPYSPGIHGYRLNGNSFQKIDYPGAVTTYSNGINKGGSLVGTYTFEQTGLPYHGYQFVNNVYTTIDYPGPGATSPGGINDSGQIAGSYYESINGHAYLYSNGVFTLLDVAGSNYTQGVGINNAGDIVGVTTDAGGHDHGFLYHNGVFTIVDYPGATDTWLLAINDKGQMVGAYGTGPLVQDFNVYHGFLDDNSNFTSFDVPFAGVAITGPYGINNKSQITGGYTDANGTRFGFIASFK
jgi:probable HAF family extracellular repeat protein